MVFVSLNTALCFKTIYIWQIPGTMHSRFWTFCAVANIFLFLNTLSVIYFNKDKVNRLDISLFHRSVVGWGSQGNVLWRDFYDAEHDNATYQAFLPQGLAAVGCDVVNRAPICQCLIQAHGRQCMAAAKEGVRNCFMNTRMVIRIDEKDNILNPFALLDLLNLWGMMGSVVLWIRMYICRDDYAMPYYIQLILGVFAAIIHSSVLEPRTGAYVLYILLACLMSGLSYYHRLDKNWWLSMYMLQYAFTMPNLATLAFVATQKRDLLYIITGLMLAVAFGFSAMGRALIDDTQDECSESRGARNFVRAAMVFIMIALTFAAYDESGQFWSRSAYNTPVAQGFNLVLLFYMVLGLLCPNNLKRVVFSDFAIRFIISMHMQAEIVMTPDLITST